MDSMIYLLDLLGWETLKEQRLKTKAKTMFKILHSMGPNCLKYIFIFKNEKLSHNFRDSSTTLRLPKPRSNSLKKSFMYDEALLSYGTFCQKILEKTKRYQFSQ
jgi:hypothetical protein